MRKEGFVILPRTAANAEKDKGEKTGPPTQTAFIHLHILAEERRP